MQEYTVRLRFQHPAWDERDGIHYEVFAPTKAKAIKAAKLKAERAGHWPDRDKGRATFTATENA